MKHYSILLCFLFATVASSYNPAKAQVDVNDSLALVDLYNSTNGSGWINNTNWLTTNPVSTWFAVTVTNKRVTRIALTYDNLTGTIPSSIGNLVSLAGLYLNDNKLSGPIPSSIGNLVNLQNIYLFNNKLSGSIPVSFGNLINLQIAWLYNNQFSGPIPSSLGNLTNLRYLEVNNNKLSGSIPSSFGNLANVFHLHLNDNQLSGPIPSSIGNLANLQYLYLFNNKLRGSIPSSIGNIVNLRYLRLNNNQLSGNIPTSFRKLKRLLVLDLSHNQLSQSYNADLLLTKKRGTGVDVSYNRSTFNGLEFLAEKFYYPIYAPQAIIPVHQHGNVLSVYAGGTLSNNTYKWFIVGSTDSTTITGDSTFLPTQSGKYYAHVTNAIASQLTLYSDTIDYTVNDLTVNNRVLANVYRNKQKQGLLVSPNPATSVVQVQLNGNATIILINSTGKVMLTKTLDGRVDINVSSYANGVYYIKNTNTGEVQKIVVSH